MEDEAKQTGGGCVAWAIGIIAFIFIAQIVVGAIGRQHGRDAACDYFRDMKDPRAQSEACR